MHLKAMAAEEGKVRVECKGVPQVIDDQLLGTEIKCQDCGEMFFADWGEPVVAFPAGQFPAGQFPAGEDEAL